MLPRAFGARVAGYHDGGDLVYAGRIGTGYTQAMARELWKRLHPLEVAAPAFDRIPPEEARRRDVRWVEPKTVIEAQFRGWTADALVRQASFKGVREDKPPREVVRELPAATALLAVSISVVKACSTLMASTVSASVSRQALTAAATCTPQSATPT